MCTERRKGKPWYQSKTVWVNLAAIMSGITPLVLHFEGLVSPLTYAAVLTILGCINVVLRVVTTEPIDNGISSKE